MKRSKIVLGVAILAVFVPLAQARPKNKIRVECQIFRFAGDAVSKTFADQEIWTTDEAPERLKDKVTVFNRGWFEIDKKRLEFKDGKCFWDKKEFPIKGPGKVALPHESITLAYSPALVMEEHDSATLEIGSKLPIQYFVRRKDGLFELKETELSTGLDIEIEAKEEEDRGYIVLEDMVMTLRSVERREKIPGVNLSVGRPILGEQEYRFFFRVKPGNDYGILIRPERGRGGLLIRLRASSTRSGTFREDDGEDKSTR